MIQAENAKNYTGAHCTYLLTIRRTRFDRTEAEDFRQYFGSLRASGCEVLVVDGSPAEIFDDYDEIWKDSCRHETVDPQYKYLNGKVNGIHTGIALAQTECVILADDDIRYTPEDVRRMSRLLDDYDMVRPQNYFLPLPFWARMEAARMLINRAFIREGDYTGTLGVTRSAMLRVGHYDGDVLFDNEEIVRHFRLKKARIKYARDFFVLKRPATFRKWIEQRPRQAYEDFIMRLKTVFFLALPIAFVLFWLLAGFPSALVFAIFIAIGAVLAAALGLKDGATEFFPISIVFYAPLWIIERSFSTYWAFYWRITRGGYPFGDKLLSKGTGNAWTAAGGTAASDDPV
ncbi:MAG: glycosyltransferase family 2 protein [Acidobacteriota bacterium]|nr:glycosyltransferase family 2 protein [Acidobacteriota bacterium]